MIQEKKLNKWLFYFIVVTLSVSPAFATSQIDNRNYLLIGSMFLGPLIVLFSSKIIPKIDFPVLLIIASTFAIQLVFYPSFRVSTVMFTCMFLVYFLAAVRTFMAARMTIYDLNSLIKILIYAYTVVLIIQQFCVLVGLPVFNFVGEYGRSSIWKLNSLSAEPSHTARYLGILMYTFLRISDLINQKTLSLKESFKLNKRVWLCFLWVMLTMVSGTAVIIVAIILIRYIRLRNAVLIAGALAGVFIIGLTTDFTPLKRSTTFLQAVASGNPKAMIAADHSASIRIVPLILCMQRINPTTVKGWIGEGIDSTTKWMSHYMPGVPHGWAGGAIARYTLEYGLFVSLIYMIFSFWCCFDKKNIFATIGFWIMCVALCGINMQITWLCILLLYIDKRLMINHADTCILR